MRSHANTATVETLTLGILPCEHNDLSIAHKRDWVDRIKVGAVEVLDARTTLLSLGGETLRMSGILVSEAPPRRRSRAVVAMGGVTGYLRAKAFEKGRHC